MNMSAVTQTNEHIMPTYGKSDVTLVQGMSATCRDSEQRVYLDFGSGIGVNSLGYCDTVWADAVCEQVRRLQHTSNLYYQAPQAKLAQMLSEYTGYAKVFFANSGAEANECAIKLARKYSFDTYGPNRSTILTLENSFHGRTMATLSATGQDSFHQYFFPFPDGFRYTKVNDIEALYQAVDDSVCAIMVEYVQGEGGVMALSPEFVQAVRKLCDERDILMIADEVQTGVGRTGKFLAGEHYDCKADITTIAKGIGGGLPIGVCMANTKCADTLSKGMHGSTFGGNPVVCAGAIAVMERITKPDTLKDIVEKANYLRAELSKLEEVKTITGLGLMIGIMLKSKKAPEVLQQCLAQGLLVLTAKDRVRLLPPLTITKEEMEEGLAILTRVLEG